MKKLFLLLFVFALVGTGNAQDLPKDVKKVFKGAEKLQSKGDYDRAVAAYKEVLRSVPTHYQSMENIGDIEMRLRAKPNYRDAHEYYKKSVDVLISAISSTSDPVAKKYLMNEKKRIDPKLNKAKSYVEDFDKAKKNRMGGNRLMDDEDVQ